MVDPAREFDDRIDMDIAPVFDCVSRVDCYTERVRIAMQCIYYPRLGIFFSSMIGLQGHFLPFSVGSVSSDLCVSKRGCAVHFLWGMDLRDTKKVAIVSNTL